ncbi:sigma-70 family RNA polymerase sigma factor [Pseudoalteromonas sp. OOF1S-7]|uniref:RNA polymerase sigma factor n=1 Tax=Pseudoalteromonas sp. OOF1S-7 TaxID=2917757 RepID=UPI001EF56B34|nr:sigma-70 family RNA polymerase sigma factor [Pseudoalteromonas sp. OOF1S-7]MCG7536527.1 sigma-70 family RNA polymerase sigma factor [Pseudoalteromonas sp. OOF1S-7]
MNEQGRELDRSAIVETYWPQISRAAKGYENRPPQREELTQDMAFALWRALGNFAGQCKLNTYVYRVIHNVAVDHIRKSSKHNEDELADEHAHSTDSPEANMQQQQKQYRLEKAIHQLPLSLRQVMLLKLEGVDTAEASDVLGISEANVGVRLHRAKTLLTEQLKENA